MDRLKGKIAVITGAGRGIGRAAAALFAAEGAVVLMLETDVEAGAHAAAALYGEGRRAKFYPVDVSNLSEVEAAFFAIESEFGGADILYNNASVFWGKRDAALDSLDMDVLERILRINLFGTVYCARCAVRQMKRRGGGVIVNTASSAGVIGIPNCDAYTAAKGGVVALTRSMAVEFGPYNIRTNCIAPAAIMTPMAVESNLNDPGFDEEFFLTRGTPLRRWGTAEEIARAALFLASPDASYLNGAILVADGGITIS